MGGRNSKPHHGHGGRGGSPASAGSSTASGPPLPALVVLDWDAAFLGARMADAAPHTNDPNHDALSASSPALAQAFRPLLDARRLIALAEHGAATLPPSPTTSLAPPQPQQPTPPLNIRGRLVLFPADLSVMNRRLHRLFHRRGYRAIVAPRELQGHAVARALGRFGRRLTRRHRGHHRRGVGQGQERPVGAVVVVAGDGGLEWHPAYASALRALLDQGFALEAWAWNAHIPALYQQLAAEHPSTPLGGGVRVRALDPHRPQLRYGGAGPTGRGGLDGLVASTLHSVAAAVVAAAVGAAPSAPPPAGTAAQQPPPPPYVPPAVPVAVPLAVGVGEGGEGVVQGYVLPPGKTLVVESSSDEEDDKEREEQAGASAGAAAAAGAALAASAQAGQGRAEEDEEEFPSYLLDPLTFEPLQDPVLAPSGYTFSRAVIMDQIRRRGTDPFTNQPLAEGDLRPNRALAEAVDLYRAQQRVVGKGGGGGGGESA